MKNASWKRSAAAMLMTAISISSCATTEQRIIKAGEVKGKVEAGVILPDQPADCRVEEAHAALKAGDEVRSVLVRERSALDRQNARTDRCADFYADVKTEFKRPIAK